MNLEFRIWDAANNKWLDPGCYAVACDKGTLQNKSCSGLIGGVQITQYIGIHDVNNKKIFNGDIISAEFATDSMKRSYDIVGEVMFENVGFIVRNITPTQKRKGGAWKYSPFYKLLRIEIIGNIYENPELLNVPVQ